MPAHSKKTQKNSKHQTTPETTPVTMDLSSGWLLSNLHLPDWRGVYRLFILSLLITRVMTANNVPANQGNLIQQTMYPGKDINAETQQIIEDLLAKAETALKKNQFEEADYLVFQALALHPPISAREFLKLQLIRGEALYGAGRKEEALQLAEFQAQSHPENGPVLSFLFSLTYDRPRSFEENSKQVIEYAEKYGGDIFHKELMTDKAAPEEYHARALFRIAKGCTLNYPELIETGIQVLDMAKAQSAKFEIGLAAIKNAYLRLTRLNFDEYKKTYKLLLSSEKMSSLRHPGLNDFSLSDIETAKKEKHILIVNPDAKLMFGGERYTAKSFMPEILIQNVENERFILVGEKSHYRLYLGYTKKLENNMFYLANANVEIPDWSLPDSNQFASKVSHIMSIEGQIFNNAAALRESGERASNETAGSMPDWMKWFIGAVSVIGAGAVWFMHWCVTQKYSSQLNTLEANLNNLIEGVSDRKWTLKTKTPLTWELELKGSRELTLKIEDDDKNHDQKLKELNLDSITIPANTLVKLSWDKIFSGEEITINKGKLVLKPHVIVSKEKNTDDKIRFRNQIIKQSEEYKKAMRKRPSESTGIIANPNVKPANIQYIAQTNALKGQLQELITKNATDKKLDTFATAARQHMLNAEGELKSAANEFVKYYEKLNNLVRDGDIFLKLERQENTQQKVNDLADFIGKFENTNKAQLVIKRAAVEEAEKNVSKTPEPSKFTSSTFFSKSKKEMKKMEQIERPEFVFDERQEDLELEKIRSGLEWAIGADVRTQEWNDNRAKESALSQQQKEIEFAVQKREQLHDIQLNEATKALEAIQDILNIYHGPRAFNVFEWCKEDKKLLGEFEKELPELVITSLLGLMARLMHCIGLFSLKYPLLKQDPEQPFRADPYSIRNVFTHHQLAYEKNAVEFLKACEEAKNAVNGLVTQLAARNTGELKLTLSSVIFSSKEVEKIDKLPPEAPDMLLARIQKHCGQLALLGRIAKKITAQNPDNYKKCVELHWMMSAQILTIGEALTNLKERSGKQGNNIYQEIIQVHGHQVDVFRCYRNKLVHAFYDIDESKRYQAIEVISPEKLKTIANATVPLTVTGHSSKEEVDESEENKSGPSARFA